VLGNGRETEEEAGEEYGDAEVAIEEELKTLSLKGKSNSHPSLDRITHTLPASTTRNAATRYSVSNSSELCSAVYIFDLNFTESAH